MLNDRILEKIWKSVEEGCFGVSETPFGLPSYRLIDTGSSFYAVDYNGARFLFEATEGGFYIHVNGEVIGSVRADDNEDPGKFSLYAKV